ncbi:MAG TPA: phosphate ABC transporter substrate-binding protein PstS [Myxococcales bacterium]|nr:phosphate ABC transporter substrate-binding protein PstS [Myxococcales bacterium]
MYRTGLVALLSVASLTLACKDEGTGTSAPSAGEPLTINGAGSTFAYPMYSKWFDEYHKLHPNTEFNYQSIGSGGGIRQVIAGTVDFGGTDGPMTPAQMADFKGKHQADILHLPTALGADVPTYNIKGVTQELNFTPDALAGIFLGKIKKWNDPAIADANPGVSLPADDIVVVHRSDGSGTTFVWVDYLAKVSPEWKQKVGVGTSVNWPVGLGGKGNEGVTGLVKQTQDSIGYVELIYAIQNHIPYGKVKNSAGKFVKADLASVTAAAAGASKAMPDDFRVSITDPPGEAAYPISSFTWLLVPAKIPDAAKRAAMLDFLSWAMADGQNLLEPLSYARLPVEVVAKERQAIARIQ